jgi:hypothetical protein
VNPAAECQFFGRRLEVTAVVPARADPVDAAGGGQMSLISRAKSDLHLKTGSNDSLCFLSPTPDDVLGRNGRAAFIPPNVHAISYPQISRFLFNPSPQCTQLMRCLSSRLGTHNQTLTRRRSESAQPSILDIGARSVVSCIGDTLSLFPASELDPALVSIFVLFLARSLRA